MAIVLGIKLSEISPSDLINKIGEFLNSDKAHYIVTPNPEIILASHKDEELFYIINKADISVPDGFGLVIAGLLQGVKIPRLAGADLSLLLLEKAEKENRKVLVMNWRGGLSKRNDIERALQKKYPRLDFFVIDLSRRHPLNKQEIDLIRDFAPEIIFNTFGSPYQEKAIFHILNKFESLRLALAVGGSFDFISGKVARAPLFMRAAGLEWLWRLILKPKRWRRIYRATIVFSSKVIRASVKHLAYRPNVACLLYKKTPFGRKILIVEREDEKGHWQIPQGGTDGETLKVAGAREMREELGTDKFIVKASFKSLHSYLFPPVSQQNDKSRFSYKFEYKGQKQGLLISEFIGDDSDIKINYWEHTNFRWVDELDFVSSIHPVRREAAKIFLEKFRSLDL